MATMILGYDDNLGLPIDFAEKIDCKTKPYHDLTEMITAFQAKELDSIFIPCGTLPYLAEYQILAQALFQPTEKPTLKSCFITAQQMKIPDISKHLIGRVNKYCTTSFWAPMIYLMTSLPAGTTLTFKNTNGFQDLLHKTATQVVDCAMEWDIFLQKNKTDSDKVHQLFYSDKLPTPVIIAHSTANHQMVEKLNQFKSSDKACFFNQFQAPDLNLIEEFMKAINQAKNHFNIIER